MHRSKISRFNLFLQVNIIKLHYVKFKFSNNAVFIITLDFSLLISCSNFPMVSDERVKLELLSKNASKASINSLLFNSKLLHNIKPILLYHCHN